MGEFSYYNHLGDVIEFADAQEFNTAVRDYADLASRHACENPLDVPGSVHTVRCNERNKRPANKCRGCSELYRGD